MKIFGEKLQELRKEKNLTQKELGEKLRVSRGSIFGWEKDLQEPSLETLAVIAKFFQVKTDYLLGLED